MTRTAAELIAALCEKFPVYQAEGMIADPRPNRVYTGAVSHQEFEQVLDYVYNELEITFFHVVVGMHVGDELHFAYVLSHRDDRVLLVLKQKVPITEPIIKTVTDKYMNALWHERELVDLFGAVVKGLPPGLTYPLPDGWPKGNYPLRKDWKVEYFDRQALNYNPPPQVEEAKPEKPAVQAAAPPAGTAPADLAKEAAPPADAAENKPPQNA